jgi:hypothetical protein
MHRLLGLATAALAACQYSPPGGGLRFSCADGRCPAGTVCVAELCVVAEGDGGPMTDARVIPPGCGDGDLDPDETCDVGPANADDGRCLVDCRLARCGDGHVRRNVEACDPARSTSCTSGCLLCQPPSEAAVGGSCLSLSLERTSWSQAVFACPPLGSSLATLTTAEEHEAAAGLVVVAGEPAWLGMTGDGGWAAGEQGDFTAWAPGQPVALSGGAGLIEPPGVWRIVQRDLDHRRICEREPVLVADDGRAFQVHHLDQESDLAAGRCDRLASVDTPAIEAFLATRLLPQRLVILRYCFLVDGVCQVASTDGSAFTFTGPCQQVQTCRALCELD